MIIAPEQETIKRFGSLMDFLTFLAGRFFGFLCGWRVCVVVAERLVAARKDCSDSSFSVDLEMIRTGDEQVVVSDLWFDMMMNFAKERARLRGYRYEMQEYTRKRGQQFMENDYHMLAKQHVSQQVAFFLSEYGCGQYLQIQPAYYTLVGVDEGRLWAGPQGLRQFGDHARSYVAENKLVGDGLMHIYEQMVELPVGALAAVVSPTEQYQDYNSATDVINFFRKLGIDDEGNAIVEAQYFVLGRVLSTKERRFLHNLYYMFANEGRIGADEVPVDRLLLQGKKLAIQDPRRADVEVLVKRPNVFFASFIQGEEPLVELIHATSNYFEARFGDRLLTQDHSRMYPIVKGLAEGRQGELLAYLYDDNREDYYGVLRELWFTCQRRWALLHEKATHPLEHIQRIIGGDLMLGFWDGGPSDMVPHGTSGDWQFGGPWQEGDEKKKYCKTHECWYTGDVCPQCSRVIFSAN